MAKVRSVRPRFLLLLACSLLGAGCGEGGNRNELPASVGESEANTRAPNGDGGESTGPVAVRIAADDYRFTLAEAAAGVTFDYDVVVAEDLEGVVPHPQDVGGASGGGPSGLMPFETISGAGQSYGLFDIGLGQPDLRPRRIRRGTYPHSFRWDGRNWGGPSDTSMPKGQPFPPGTYTLQVRVKGEIETPEGQKPYDVSDTARVVLTP